MAEKIKSADNLRITYWPNVGAVVIALYGRPTAAFPAPLVQQSTGDISVMLQNRSTFTCQISTDPAATNGLQILDGHAVTFDISDAWNGMIYMVDAGGLATADWAILVMNQR